ncbi:MAG: type II toxin-antitoxin system ParD family antitoxin [Tannerella sp.]|jgi:antitoxin ParD1/3/4|nr:type II toxin-antitoxin system ParD family antitoxin [Tannerella sp.]
MEISLGTYYDRFMSDAVMSGRYSSKNDVVRKAILLLEMEEKKMNMLRNELIEGEMSQMIENQTSNISL